jgi:DNA invertase Pin-like site-specific DNA recombinase
VEGTRAIGYVYVAAGASPDLVEQTAAIERCCRARGLELSRVVHDVAHPEHGHHRPSLITALEQVAGGQVHTLVVARLRDLAFNAADVPPLLRWFDQEHRSLIALDTAVDAPDLDQHIARMRAGGMTLQAIADALNAGGVPTVRGGATWRPSSVQRATGYRRPPSRSRGIELPHTRRSGP